MSERDMLVAQVDEVRGEAIVWQTIPPTLADIVTKVRRMQLMQPGFNPFFFTRVVEEHAAVGRKVIDRCGEGQGVTNRIYGTLATVAEVYDDILRRWDLDHGGGQQQPPLPTRRPR